MTTAWHPPASNNPDRSFTVIVTEHNHPPRVAPVTRWVPCADHVVHALDPSHLSPGFTVTTHPQTKHQETNKTAFNTVAAHPAAHPAHTQGVYRA